MKHKRKNRTIQQPGTQKIGTLNQGSWISLLAFLKPKEMARLSQTSKSIQESVAHTPCAFLNKTTSPLEESKRTTLSFQEVSTLNNRAKELRSLIKANPLSIRYKIADATLSLHLSDVCNRLYNYYSSNVDLHEKLKETYLHAVLPAIGVYAGMQIGSICNSSIHYLMGGNVAVDFLLGGALYCASNVMFSLATGAIIGKCAGYPFKQYGQYVGQMTTSVAALASSQLAGIYYGIDKMVNDSSTSTALFSGAIALTALGLYKNKVSIDAKESCMELKAIKNELSNLKRIR